MRDQFITLLKPERELHVAIVYPFAWKVKKISDNEYVGRRDNDVTLSSNINGWQTLLARSITIE